MSKRFALPAVVLVAFVASAPGQAMRLDPAPESGQRWSFTSSRLWQYQTMEAHNLQLPADGFDQIETRGEFRVLSAAAGTLQEAEIFFELAENRSKPIGGNRPVAHRAAVHGKTVRIARLPGAENDLTRWAVDCPGSVLDPSVSAALRDSVARSIFPARPVARGEEIELKDIDLLFAPDWKGRGSMRFVDVQRGPDGRSYAVVQVRGNASTETPAAGQKLDTQLSYDFQGVIRVDLQTRQIAAIDLDGPFSLVAGAAGGMGMTYGGRGTWQVRYVPLPPMQVTPPQPQPQPAPRPEPQPQPAPRPAPPPQPAPQPAPPEEPSIGGGKFGGNLPRPAPTPRPEPAPQPGPAPQPAAGGQRLPPGEFRDPAGFYTVVFPAGWTLTHLEDGGRKGAFFTHESGLQMNLIWWTQLPEDLSPRNMWFVILRGLLLNLSPTWGPDGPFEVLGRAGHQGSAVVKGGEKIVQFTTIVGDYAPTFSFYGPEALVNQQQAMFEGIVRSTRLVQAPPPPRRN